uniref:DNA/RNA polymerases superfamily protein n=1 Tax=Tanacetum cinerariifolium TaxID=118510 RepID=A0A6L2K8Y3_TANCI|nr:DNA/RNA polymerases superfamily protein [Tanacetum cinerariifolium]
MLRACAIDFGGNWDTHLPLVEFSYNNSYELSVKCSLFEALYGRKYQTRIAREEVGESKLIGPDIVQETTDKILRLSQELLGIHDTFYVSNRKKCLADIKLQVPLQEIKIDNGLRFDEEPIEVMDREVKKLKQSNILIVKIRWNSRREPEFTWEQEDEMKRKYLQLRDAFPFNEGNCDIR